jgi:hypothetical protein
MMKDGLGLVWPANKDAVSPPTRARILPAKHFSFRDLVPPESRSWQTQAFRFMTHFCR